MILTAVGDAPAAEAWERYAAPARWSQWAPQIRRVETPGARITPGLTGVVVGPVGLRVGFRVLEVDEAERSWSWRVGVGPASVTMRHSVTAEAGGTRTTLELSGPAAMLPVLIAYAPVAGHALRRLVRA